jgi:hypothetical protein
MDLTVTTLATEGTSTALDTALTVVPVALFLVLFHRVVLKQRLANPFRIVVGFVLIIVGLTSLLLGLEKALFPVGRLMVEQLVAMVDEHSSGAVLHWTAYYPIYLFAFCIAFGAAAAEPALLSIALKVNEISGGTVPALGLRIAAGVGVAGGVTLGCIRIAADIPLHWLAAAIYVVIIVQTFLAPRSIVPIAYDSGGVSTTAVTVPVITALGLGLAEQLPGRDPLRDGFGLIALACFCAAVSVLGYAQIAAWLDKRTARAASARSGSRKEE